MKLTRYISLTIALLSVLSITAQQQQSQYALYNYRNDGDFNAWLNIDIDSITYSNIGLDSIEYDNIVTQEVWTPDSCYRIPIEAIDSIGFRAPEPEFKEGIFYIEEQHLPYILDADDLSVTFASSTPYYLLPSNGQILYSDLEEEPFIMGFAGRVVEVINSTEGIIYKCESVSPSDVYDRYLDVFKVVSSEDETEDMSELKHSPRKARRRNIQKDGTIIAPEIKWNIGFKNYLSFDAKISNTFDYVISVGITSKDYIKITHTKKTDYSVKTSVSSDDLVDLLTADESGNKKYSPDPVWLPFSYPLVGCKFLQVYLNCGLYFEAKGSFELSAKLPYSSTSVEEYYFSSDNNWIPTYTESNEGGWPGMNEFLSDGKVEFKLKGSAAFGPIVALGISAWKPKFCSLSVQAKAGLELSGECSVDFVEITQGDFSVYKLLSEDTKITTGLNVGVELVASVKDKDYKIASFGTTICKREKYLLPRFTTPEMPQYTGMGWGDGLDSLAVYTNPSNDLLLPGKVGIGVYNSQGDVVSETYPIWYFGSSGWEDNSLSYDFRKLPPGESYEVRPLFSLLGLLDIKANPETTIDIPNPMTLDIDSPLNSVTLKKGEEGLYAINGGWGNYSVSSSIESLCSASLETVYNRPHIKLVASNYVTGSAVITVKDLRAGTTETILVTVLDDITPELVVSEETVSLKENETTTVLITSGSGSYIVESSDDNVATATIEEDKIVIVAISEGVTVITVTDTQTGKTVELEVAVAADYGGDVPTDGLVAYYPFNGNANDESGNGNNGSVIGSVELTTDRFGNLNSAYRFPGSPFNYISVPDNETLHCSTFTLNAWVYTDADNYGSEYLICKGRDINNGSYRLCVRNVGAQNRYDGSNDAYMDGIPEVGVWHMVTGSVEGKVARFYLDGVLMDERQLSSSFSYGNSDPMTLGMHYYVGVPSGWAYPLLGVLDDVRIYNRVLTDKEIKALYQEP